MNNLKRDALLLRKQGYSYNLIRDRLGISKSTLSNWLAEIPFVPNQLVKNRIKNASLRMVTTKQNQKFLTWNKIKEEAKREVGSLTDRDLFMLGIGLYIGEGTKSFSTVTIANSDPKVIKLAISWLSRVCNVPLNHLTLAIHLYPDNNIEDTLLFWQKQTGIPIKDFGKTQVDKRENKSRMKRRKLLYGTAHLKVKTNGDSRFGVQLLRRILAWIDSTTNEILE